MPIHHYTTIETLALIIKTKSIRFNRTDKVDDSDESEGVDPNWEKYVFISCWTRDDKESIALWKMYASVDKGVRISFENENIFKRHDYKISDVLQHMAITCVNSVTAAASIKSINEVLSVIKGTDKDKKFNELSLHPTQVQNEDYWALDLQLGDLIPFCDVQYVTDKQKVLAEHVSSTEIGVMMDTDFIGTVKSDYWAFQKESRFVIRTHPIGDTAKGENLKRLLNQEDLATGYIDAELSEQALHSMTITIAPLANKESEEIVKLMLNEYPEINIKQSKLKGKIRK